MARTPNADIPLLEAGSLQIDAVFNEFAGIVDAWQNCVVLEVGRNAPSGTEVNGNRVIVGTGTGAFTGHDNELAILLGGTWQFYAPPAAGVPIIKDLATGDDWQFDDTGVWSAKAGAGGDVTGPASSVDLRIAVFDGITGKSLKDGGKTVAELLVGSHVINAQTGTSYAILSTDRGKHLTLSNAASIAVTIAQAGTTGFEDGFFTFFEVLGAGAVTITPTTSTINGAAALVLNSGMSGILFSDGTNYRVMLLDQSGITVNPQTGTSYTYLSGDRGKLVSHSNAAAIAGTLPQATGAFGARWFMYVQNRGAGTLTITPTTSTIDGASSLALTTGQGCVVASDGTNYFTMRGMATGGGGGLTNFTEGVNSSTPNGTVTVVYLNATNAATHVDFVIKPKGVGAILAAIPDNLTAGGNKRGQYAVDLQTSRANAIEVASGNYSGLFAGSNNKSTADNAAVVGGTNGTSSGAKAFIGGGVSGTSSGANAAQIGGNSSTASGSQSVGLGGTVVVASGANSVAMGSYGNTRTIDHAFAMGCANGRQALLLPLYVDTSDATPTRLRSNNSAAAVTNQASLPSGRAAIWRVRVVARQTSGSGTVGDSAGWDTNVLIKNIGGTTSIVGTPSVSQAYGDTGAAAWAIALTADNTLDTLNITVTGEASKTIQWTAQVIGPES